MSEAVKPAPGKRSGMKLTGAMALYGVLLVLGLTTLSEWRIRLVTVAVIALFAGRTLWQPRIEAAPAPWGREADRPM